MHFVLFIKLKFREIYLLPEKCGENQAFARLP